MADIYSTAGQQQFAKDNGIDFSGSNPVIDMLKRLLYPADAGALSASRFGLGLEPARQSAIQSLIQRLSPANLQAQRNALNAQTQQLGAQAQKRAAMQNQASGLGSGYTAGNNAGLADQTALAQIQTNRQYADPGFQAQAAQAQLGAIGAGQQNPYLSQLYGALGPIQQQNETNYAHRGQGLLGALAGYAGQATGIYNKATTGGLGGGGSAPSSGGGLGFSSGPQAQNSDGSYQWGS